MVSVERVLHQIKLGVNENAALVHRGRFVDLTFVLGVSDDDYLISVERGQIREIAVKSLATEGGVFCIRAPIEHWQKFWQPVPVRDYQDLFSMLPKRYAIIDGDVLPLMQNLQYFKDVLACGRSAGETRHA